MNFDWIIVNLKRVVGYKCEFTLFFSYRLNVYLFILQ